MRKNWMGAAVIALSVMAASASAAPTCASLVVSSAVSVVTINGLGGCTVGNYLFNNFAVTNASPGTGSAEIDLTQGGVAVVGSEIFLNFNPNLGAGTTGGTITDLHFTFNVSGGLLNGADLDNSTSINSSINELNCSGGVNVIGNSASCAGSTLWNTLALSGQSTTCFGNVAGGNGTSNPCAYGTGTATPVFVFKDISIGDPSSSHNTSFTESFLTPEPMTFSLMGIGLLGLGIVGRRIRK